MGKSEIYTLTSARLVNHFDNIVKDLQRTNLGYEFMRLLDRAPEKGAGPEYFDLLAQAFGALDNSKVSIEVTGVWFKAQLIKLAGHSPNLQTTTAGQKLSASSKYNFDFDSMHFHELGRGAYNANHIKFLRLLYSSNPPQVLGKIEDAKKLAATLEPLVSTVLQNFVRV